MWFLLPAALVGFWFFAKHKAKTVLPSSGLAQSSSGPPPSPLPMTFHSGDATTVIQHASPPPPPPGNGGIVASGAVHLVEPETNAPVGPTPPPIHVLDDDSDTHTGMGTTTHGAAGLLSAAPRPVAPAFGGRPLTSPAPNPLVRPGAPAKAPVKPLTIKAATVKPSAIAKAAPKPVPAKSTVSQVSGAVKQAQSAVKQAQSAEKSLSGIFGGGGGGDDDGGGGGDTGDDGGDS